MKIRGTGRWKRLPVILSLFLMKKDRKLFLSDLWSSVQGIACSRTEFGLQSSEESS